VLDPFQFLLIAVSGWMNHRQLQVIEYLREENRVLREQLGDRRVRLNDNQRRRLAVNAKALGRKALAEVASIVYATVDRSDASAVRGLTDAYTYRRPFEKMFHRMTSKRK